MTGKPWKMSILERVWLAIGAVVALAAFVLCIFDMTGRTEYGALWTLEATASFVLFVLFVYCVLGACGWQDDPLTPRSR